MKNKMINFKEGDGLEVHKRLLEDQITSIEFQLIKSKDKLDQVNLRNRLEELRKEYIEHNRIDFNI